MKQVVLDSGALIALERRDRRMLAITDALVARRRTAIVPAGVVAQCWRASARQHAVARLLKHGAVTIHPMSDEVAYAVGALLARSGTADVVDGHVALLATRMRATVVTSDPDDMRSIDSSLDLLVL